MLACLALRALSLWLVLVAGCSTGLSPYAAEDFDPEFAAARPRDAGSTPTATSTSRPAPASAPPAVATALPPPVVSPPPDPPAVIDSADGDEPWFSLDQDLPDCRIQNLTVDCPAAETVLAAQGGEALPCRPNQLGHRCAYPSAKREANLLECTRVDGGGGPAWHFRRGRCARDCFNEIPHSFVELSTSDCQARALYACDDAATEQDSADNLLKGIARTCGLPRSRVLGLLLSSDGCGRALFLDAVTASQCAADELRRWRFGCRPRCVSTKESGDILLK